MSRSKRPSAASRGAVLIALALGVGLTLGAGLVAEGRQQSAQHSRSEFMRKKLDYAQGLIEGLTMEKYDLITKNARALKVLSQAAEWEVPTIPNFEQYLPYTAEFQGLCDELMRQSRDRNIDGATLAYVRLTLNCVNCHKYVRGDTPAAPEPDSAPGAP